MKYRDRLPQLNDCICLTDGGLETVLLFEHGIELPEFAAFTLLDREGGPEILREYYRPYIEIALKHELGLLLGCPTWRASPKWGALLGYDDDALDAINRRCVTLMESIRSEYETSTSPMPISASIGPKGDGYAPAAIHTVEDSANYHSHQVEVLADTAADFLSAMTMSHTNEAIGIIQAAKLHGMPIAVSFTVETDGRLPSGETLGEAIQRCDHETDRYAAYFMVNCAHPSHFCGTMQTNDPWVKRLGGVRANASKLSHAELDNSTELDRGCPNDLAEEILALRRIAPGLNVIGGCCGTDQEHIAKIAEALREAGKASSSCVTPKVNHDQLD